MTRRELVGRVAVAAAGAATALAGAAPARAEAGGGAFTLPALPYAEDALEPSIDAMTMGIHHGKHHAAYVSKLNDAIAQAPSLKGRSIEEILRNINDVPEAVRASVRNNGGGHANHTLFWTVLKKGGAQPAGSFAKAIDAAFGSLDALKKSLTDAGMTRFGSGWSWLCVGGDKKLGVESSPNQDSPLMEGRTPILGIDVWEHAYYLKYQNRRNEYLAAIFNVIDWEAVGKNYEKAAG
ncbi:MAG: superoxide dismutase [Verrucomicrobiae bacterium]|nr:superoxide dismutase [Verrucomicrobiae bacterium]